MKKLIYVLIGAFLLVPILSFSAAAFSEPSNKDDWSEYAETLCDKWGICPEFVEAIIEKESGWDKDAENGNCVGLMQVNPRYHSERMARLGVTDLKDPYDNILVGVDYLRELFQEYEDPALVLMIYNAGDSDKYGSGAWETGKVSDYAKWVLKRSAELEREHGK